MPLDKSQKNGGESPAVAARSPATSSPLVPPPFVGGSKEADMLASAQKMMAENPEMAKMAAEMMKNMPPEQLAAMTENSGIPGMKVGELPGGVSLG